MAALAPGRGALAAFAPGGSPVLWPGHFDAAIRLHGVNSGVSPGEGFTEEPYAYAGVSPAAAGDGFRSPVRCRRAAG